MGEQLAKGKELGALKPVSNSQMTLTLTCLTCEWERGIQPTLHSAQDVVCPRASPAISHSATLKLSQFLKHWTLLLPPPTSP